MVASRLLLALWPVAACLGSLIWWHLADLHPGMQPARGVLPFVALAAAAAAWALWRHSPASAGIARSKPAGEPALPGETQAWWRRPHLWAALALAWQACSLAWAPVHEPGLLWLGERGAMLAVAAGIALLGASAPLVAAGMGGCLLLVLAAASQVPIAGSTLGLVSTIGMDAPAGLPNFTIGAAVPLAVLAWAAPARWRYPALGVAIVALVVLGTGALSGDPARGAWVAVGGIAVALIGLVLVQRLAIPSWWLALLPALGVVFAAVLAWSPEALGDAGASTVQRPWMWRCAFESLAGPAVLVGHGIGSSIAVLPEQPSWAGVWLSVPSWVEHPHHEGLQALIDGGLINLVLLSLLLWATLDPLWRRREDPRCSLLLIAWAAAGAVALIEMHASQPVPLVALAVLAGCSWGVAQQPAPARGWAALAAVAAVVVAVQAWREPFAQGGAAPGIHRRAQNAVAAANAADPVDRAAQERVIGDLRRRLGPLAENDRDLGQLALVRGDLATAERLLLTHLRRLPCDPAAYGTLDHLIARLQRGGDLRAMAVRSERDRLLALGRAWLHRVPEQPRTKELRARLRALDDQP